MDTDTGPQLILHYYGVRVSELAVDDGNVGGYVVMVKRWGEVVIWLRWNWQGFHWLQVQWLRTAVRQWWCHHWIRCKFCWHWFNTVIHNNRLTALYPGLPGWAGTRRNIDPLMRGTHGWYMPSSGFYGAREYYRGRCTDNPAGSHPIQTIGVPTSIIPTIFYAGCHFCQNPRRLS